MPQTQAISFSNVTKKFSSYIAIENVSFDIAKGEFFALTGVNGAGKTTLIKCLLDFCAVDSGNISIWGTSSKQYLSRKEMVFLPERFNPPYYLKGHDFLNMMKNLHGGDFSKEKINDMLKALDFDTAALKKPVRTLSKGMTQKLGMAGILLTAKPLFILDEPMSGLDPKARAMLKNKLMTLKASGATILFTSHQLVDVEELADRMAILHEGKIRFCGTPNELQTIMNSTNLEAAFLKAIN